MNNEKTINNNSVKKPRKTSIVLVPEYIIVSLIKADKKKYLTMSRLFHFVSYLRQQLYEESDLHLKYKVIFDINFESIERAVKYNGYVFDLIGHTIITKINRYPPIPRNVQNFLPEFIEGFTNKYAV
jgi:hypothetical protein